MTARELVQIVVKLFTLFLLITSLLFFQSIVLAIMSLIQNTGAQSYLFIYSIVPFFIFLISAIIILLLNKWISKLIVRKDADLNINVSLADLQASNFAMLTKTMHIISGSLRLINNK